MTPLKSSILTVAAIAAILALGSAFACLHQHLPEHLSANPGLYSAAFVLIP